MASETAKRAHERIRDWRVNPCKFVYDVFGATPDAWQEEFLNECGRPGRKRIAMKACAGPGKSAGLAWAGWHRMACFAERNEHPKGAAVSITRDNLETNLWAELAKWRNASPLMSELFDWTATKIFHKEHPETWTLTAKSFPKTANLESVGNTLSGLHSRFPFFLIDESGDMAPQVANSAEQALSTCADGLIATAGNPTSTNGLLYAVAGPKRSNWVVITITGDPDDPRRSPRIDREWAREQIAKHGRDNPWVMSFILGVFPPGGLNQLVSVEEVEAAMERHLRPEAYNFSQKRLGIDVARFGDDRTVIFPRQGLAAFNPVEMRHNRGPEIAARVAQAREKWGQELELIDGTGGYGSGVIDALHVAGFNPIDVQFGGKARDPKYWNARAEMYFEVAKWIRRGGALPKIPRLVSQLTAHTYSFRDSKFILTEKDQVKKALGGQSPDDSDALAATFFLPDMPASLATIHPALGRQGNFARMDYDPLENA